MPQASHLAPFIIRPGTLILFSASAALANPITFDSTDTFTSSFLVTGDALAAEASGGLNDSGNVAFAASDDNGFATLQPESIDTSELEGDFTIRQRIFFKTGTRSSFERDNRRALNIGLTGSASVSYGGSGLLAEGAAYASLFIADAVTAEGSISANLAFTTSQPDNYAMLTSTAYMLQPDTWYALAAEYDFPAGFESLSVKVTLHSATESGEIIQELGNASSASTDVQALFGADAILRGFFGTRSAERTNIARIDEATLLELDYTPPPPPIGEPWRSILYPVEWTPPEQRPVTFADDMMIQDFSYAGYHRGEKAIPDTREPIFNVLDYGADPGGTEDSTVAIQEAIDAAESIRGGVVYLPEGIYKVQPQGNASEALRIRASNIILRGEGPEKTFIWNTATAMRNSTIIRIAVPNIAGWRLPGFGSPTPAIVENVPGPSKQVQVASVEGFAVGDYVVIDLTLTDGWALEHNVPEWQGASLDQRYLRQIKAIDPENDTLHFHIPLRYSINTREFPRVYKVFPQIQESGIEGLAIGNTEHPGTGFADNDYAIEGTAAYDCHNSFAIRINNAINCWVRDVATFAPEGNESDHHLLSNGIEVTESINITLEDCHMLYPQFGGGGGNGYLYRISGNETLLKNCSARFGRHNFVIAGFNASGNVFYRCFSEFTGYPGSARASDTHIRLSQSNLWDNVRLKKDYLESKYRPVDTSSGGFGTVFGVTQTHGVYWNTYGDEYLPGYPYIVHSDQFNFGYVIGTQGPASDVTTLSADASRTAPVDFLEGIGDGALLSPQSLYEDQFERRRLRENFTPFYATPESNGYKEINWFGWVADSAFPNVYHHELGWFTLLAPTLEDFYLYFPNNGFHYTNASLFPFFYQVADGAWLYFIGDAGGGYRLYYNFLLGDYEYQQ